ncbi:MAG: DUF3786 domain-containing protein [Deltaproteobacteria bacterium]|jgi:hypothetical protein|nr:DUF3786 domain-containing protein [Deltaproteobacteria bacterium]
MSRAKTVKARQYYCQAQLENLAKVDIPGQAGPLGFTLDSGGRGELEFFGRRLLVDNRSVTAADGGPVTIDAQSVVAHYVASRGRAALSGVFVPIARLTGIGVSASSPSESLTKPLTDMIGGNYELLAEAAPKIGGLHAGLSQAGAQSWEFGLPRLPVRIEFFEADEEFEAELKVLFDSTANQYVSYECLELLTMCLVVDLLTAANLIKDPDDCQNSFLQ